MRPSWLKSHAVPPTTNPCAAFSAANAGTPFLGSTVKACAAPASFGALPTREAGTPAAITRSSMCSTVACDCATTPTRYPRSATSRAMTCEPT